MQNSPTPEEEAILLGDIKYETKPEIKHEVELSQVPEQLEIHEQVQPEELIAISTAFLPSLLPHPVTSFLEGKEALGKSNQSGCNQCCPVGLGLPRRKIKGAWMVERVSLLTPVPLWLCNPKLAHQQAVAFWIPVTQLKKDGWSIALPCLEVLGWEKYLLLKDFHESHDYQEVRKEETGGLGCGYSELCC